MRHISTKPIYLELKHLKGSKVGERGRDSSGEPVLGNVKCIQVGKPSANVSGNASVEHVSLNLKRFQGRQIVQGARELAREEIEGEVQGAEACDATEARRKGALKLVEPEGEGCER